MDIIVPYVTPIILQIWTNVHGKTYVLMKYNNTLSIVPIIKSLIHVTFRLISSSIQSPIFRIMSLSKSIPISLSNRPSSNDNSLQCNQINRHYCYLLRSIHPKYSRKTYVGYTVNPARRLRQHNGEIVGGAKKTSYARPWVMVCYIEGFPTERIALQYEWINHHPKSLAKYKYFKSTPTKIPLTMIHSQNSYSQSLIPTRYSTTPSQTTVKSKKRQYRKVKSVYRYGLNAAINTLSETLIMDRWTKTAPLTISMNFIIHWLEPGHRMTFLTTSYPSNCQEVYDY